MEMSDHDDGAQVAPTSPASFCSADGNNNHHVTPDGNNNNDGGSGGMTGVDYIDQPVKDPHPHDVLCGRGGNINSHPGNERFRTLVDKRKRVYLTARFKREKRLIASSIVSEIRTLKPAGRFLSQDKKTGVWKDIGDEKARDKTSQALRENAPTIRAKIETEINDQREEMKKEEADHHHHPNVAPSHHAQHAAAPPHAAHHAPPFYGGWVPYPYYGYAQHPPPPPPPPQSQIRYYPPPPTPSEQPPIWGRFYPPAAAGAAASAATTKPQTKSAIEQTVDYINSGAESVKSWTRTSLSFGGDVSLAGTTSVHTADHNDHNEGGSIASVASKPLSYVHQDDSKKRRIVKFRSDTKQRVTSRRRMGSVTGHLPPAYPLDSSSTHSLLDDGGNSTAGGDVDDSQGHEMMEPHNLDEEQNNSLMTQVANQILGSIGSWDAGSILCGTDNSDRHDAPFPRHHSHHHSSSASAAASAAAMAGGAGDAALADELEDDMAVEWEGQEVQLLDPRSAAVPDCASSVASEDRMPPPSRGHHSAFAEQTSVAFSSLGSCHSWMPEQFGSVSSFFGGAAGSRAGAESMDMDHYSAVHSTGGGTENYSAAGSLGGNSLMRVFENEASVPDGHSSSSVQQYNNRNSISQVPSWDRSFRSRSPLSIESSDDDASLMSKDDTTVSSKGPEIGGGRGGGANIPVSPVTHSTTTAPTPPPPESDVYLGGMAWETRE